MLSFVREGHGAFLQLTNLDFVLSQRGVNSLFLLTLFVGLIVPAIAQQEPSDSLRNSGGLPDSLRINRAEDRFDLSTDSIYSTAREDNGVLGSMVEYTASDSINGSIAEGFIYLYKDAYVKYEDFELKAGFIKVDFNHSEVYAEGIRDSSGKVIQKPVFIESGKSYRADNMRYNFESKKAKIYKVITKEGDGFLHGEEVKKTDDNTFYVKKAAYTTCSHEHPHYNIVTAKAKMVGGDKVVTRFAYLEILDVPTPLMVPFGFFPTTSKRKSGIILPSYGSSQYRGFFLRGGGYYWAINDYVDLTVLGDIYSQGGYGWNVSSNYRKRYGYSGNLSLSYNRVSFGREEFQQFVPSAFDNRSDFAIRWTHNQDAKSRPDFRFNSSVNIASSNYYKVTGVNANDVLQNQLASSISFQKNFPGKPFNLSISLNHSQNNQTGDLTLKLPQFNFGVNRLFPFQKQIRVGKKKWYEEIGFTYNVTGQNTIETKLGKPIFTESVFRDSSRNGIRHNIDMSANYKIMKFFVLTPSFNYAERWYFQQSVWAYDEERQRASVVDTLGGFFGVRDFQTAANVSTKLYGTWQYRGFIRAIRHVMTPSVGMSYRPDFGSDFWGYYQEVQVDSLGNTEKFSKYNYGIYGSPSDGAQGNVNFNLLNTLEAKVRDRRDSTGLKKVSILERFSLSTSYNMAATQFNWAPLNLNASSSALDNLISMNYNARFDFYGYDNESGQRVNESALLVNNKLLRPTSQTLALGINLNSKRFSSETERKRKEGGEPEVQDGATIGASNLGVTAGDIDFYSQSGMIDFNLPWNVRLDYNISQTYSGLVPTINQSITAAGDFELTQNWRLGFRTGYDIQSNDFTYTSLDFYRDLHCWELRATWVPFGFQQSYMISIKVKSQMLSDLKLERRRGYGDYPPVL